MSLKKNKNIVFEESTHKYWDENDLNKKFISVTTLIGKYEQPFNKEFWSGYKAIEKCLPAAEWAAVKKVLLGTMKITPEILETYNISTEDFDKAKQEILDDWKAKNQESCTRGTAIHAEIENSFYTAGKNCTVQKFGVGGTFECRKDYTELDLPYGIYPEYLISRISDDGILCVAGQIDLMIKNGNEITLVDHKTNKSIDQKSFFNPITKKSAKMKYPLSKLDDCNFMHYSLQLSTYAWMLQKLNPDFVIKDLILNHYDHEGNNTLYHCEYLKHEVELMLAHYKKERMKEIQRDAYKPIEY